MSYAAVPESSKRANAPAIVIDLRCLQSIQYAERGIQGHSRNTVLRAREVSTLARQARIIGIIDPNLDPLTAEVAAAVDEVRPNGYVPDLPAGSVFLQLSPMQPDPVFIARLLTNDKIRKAALVYDFIPFDDQARYLRDQATRLDYVTALAWLRRYDSYLPISADTQRRLGELYPKALGSSVITGVPLAPWLEAAGPPEPPRHILAVAGDDARKNPELLIRAHAASAILQDLKIPLIITGNYSPERQQEFRALAVRHGGAAKLLSMPGRVSEAVLRQQYTQAICVVTPSRAEGFSMPVIEAMAAGVPALASDIPPHAALIEDAALRFGVDDDEALRVLLERLATQQGYREGIIQAQSGMWPQFRASAVAAKIWAAVENMQPLPRIAVMHRPRVAMLTPLPPAKSGVANYSAEVAKVLAEKVDLVLFSPQPNHQAELVSGLPHLSKRFDRVVSVLANSTLHHDIYDLAVRYGSACICHDARLMGLVTSRFGVAKAAEMASLETGRVVTATEISEWAHNERRREANFFGELTQAAKPLIFHSRASVSAVQKRFGREAVYLPFGVLLPWAPGQITAPAQAAARDRLGLSRSDTLICSFGIIDACKGIEPALQAMALLKRAGLACRLLWIGEAPPDVEIFEARAAALGIAQQVYFHRDFVTEAMFRDYLLAADCGLQLRIGGIGNISGALEDCITAGLPSVAGEDLAANLNAPSYIKRVEDMLYPREIAAALRKLIETKTARDAFEAERAAYCEEHSMENYARSLCRALELEV